MKFCLATTALLAHQVSVAAFAGIKVGAQVSCQAPTSIFGRNFPLCATKEDDSKAEKASISSPESDAQARASLEQELREQIAVKNSEGIKDEKRYMVVDGSIGDMLEDEEAKVSEQADALASAVASLSSAEDSDNIGGAPSGLPAGMNLTLMKEEMLKATKIRPYPLFLAEKAAMIVDDIREALQEEDEYATYGQGLGKKEEEKASKKERVVILGTGWGAAAFLKEVDTKKFDVTTISPRNYFLFTPMLAGASVGTVEYRSITQPIRQINPRAKFIEATATSIDPKARTISCESVVCEGNSCSIDDFTLEYDRLIISVGAQTNTFGIPGVREHCCFLKQVEDAQRIRTAVVNCFERASFPNLSEEEKERILTFAVIGAGPTGVEFASELRDFIEEDGPKYYPKLLKYVRIKIIEASNTILGPFDESLQKAAMAALDRRVTLKSGDPGLLPSQFKFTELLLDSGVQEVTQNAILLNNNKTVSYGVAVWAAGNGPLPITLQLINSLGDTEQADAQSVARGRIAIDPWLRVLGGDGKIFAFGDCTCNTNYQLPATAQVAGQQGEHLGHLFSQCDMDLKDGDNNLLPPLKNFDDDREELLAEKVTSFALQTSQIAAPFQFWNLGILAYTGGGSALAQLQVAPSDKARLKGRGKVGFGLWRSVYLTKQISPRNRILVAIDWAKTKFFGRDITRTS